MSESERVPSPFDEIQFDEILFEFDGRKIEDIPTPELPGLYLESLKRLAIATETSGMQLDGDALKAIADFSEPNIEHEWLEAVLVVRAVATFLGVRL